MQDERPVVMSGYLERQERHSFPYNHDKQINQMSKGT